MRSLTMEEAGRILASSVARRFRDGGAVFRQGEQGQSIYLVLKGEVRLTTGGSDGEIIDVARKGDLFGEGELCAAREARACTALASGDVDVVELPAALLKEVGRANPKLVEVVQRFYLGRRDPAPPAEASDSDADAESGADLDDLLERF